jgi:hypothetical protein
LFELISFVCVISDPKSICQCLFPSMENHSFDFICLCYFKSEIKALMLKLYYSILLKIICLNWFYVFVLFNSKTVLFASIEKHLFELILFVYVISDFKSKSQF